ncbi:hypothetical protein RR47_GL001803 [Enterococcus columbae DSM 7374 = ATCC 51263]|nr:hypothetical protein RR47_GL001803 [Enterococcus columbae DSM 7374 = ATCC 51263]
MIKTYIDLHHSQTPQLTSLRSQVIKTYIDLHHSQTCGIG